MVDINAMVVVEQKVHAPVEYNETGMFLVFYFDQFYPHGGFNDFIGMALSFDQAREMVKNHRSGSASQGTYQIVDYKKLEFLETKTVGYAH